MRSEREIIGNILAVAAADDNVRAVIRTDLQPVRKYLYAYNFCLVVNDVEKYDGDSFAACFGDRILLYRGDRNYPELFPDTRAHLMVFRDGITLAIHAMDRRVFLSRFNREQPRENVWIGDTYQMILDKDGTLEIADRLEESQTLFAEAPSREAFLNTCNEFWWVLKTFAEYTLREELLSAMFYLNVAVRGLLNRMLRWHIYLQAGRPVDMGILDSRMEALLDADLFALYRKTYPDADYAHIRDAYDAVTALWGRAGRSVAARCGFDYPQDAEADMLAFIRNLRNLKSEA